MYDGIDEITLKREARYREYFFRYWKPYGEFVPEERHVQSKAATYTVEGYNSLFRHNSPDCGANPNATASAGKMLEHSVRLLMSKWNNQLSI